MLPFTRNLWLSLFVLNLRGVLSQNHSGGFSDPSAEYRPKFRYWLPDASVSPDVVRRDIEDLKDAGAGGFEFLPFYYYGIPINGPPTDWAKYGFGTPAFKEIFDSALQAVADNGLLMDFALGANQGQGVPSVPATSGLALQLLLGNATVKSGGVFDGELPPATEISSYATGQGQTEQVANNPTELVAVVVGKILSTENSTEATIVKIDDATVAELTNQVEDGKLRWQAPEGEGNWKLFAMYQQYTSQRSCVGGVNATTWLGNGSWIVDHFSSTGAQRITDFFDQYVIEGGDTAGLLDSVGNYAWEDSIEMTSALWWTPGFLDRFKTQHGYSLSNYLPLLFNKQNSFVQSEAPYSEVYEYGNYTAAGTNQQDSDYHTTLNDGYQQYIKHYVAWAHSKGVNYSSQPAYNLPLDMTDDIPILDAPEGESLAFKYIDSFRQFTGPAHLAGKRVISSELGADMIGAYRQPVKDMLRILKSSLAGGFSMHVIHGMPYSGDYPQTTWPGYTTFWYLFTEMWNRIQPSWIHMKDALDFVARNQYILQSGTPKVDLAFYQYNAPLIQATIQYQSSNLETLGYTYEYLGPKNLQSPQAEVKDGVLAPSGPAYKALIFSNQTQISPGAVDAVKSFASQGLPIFFLGTPPNATIGFNATADTYVKDAVQSLIETEGVYSITSADELLEALSQAGIIPRTTLSETSAGVITQWRSAEDGGYVYLFNNDTEDAASGIVKFAVPQKSVPYELDAFTGRQTPILEYNRSDGGLEIPITLASNQSTIFGFFAPSNNLSFPAIHATSTSNGTKLSFDYKTGISAHCSGPCSVTLSNNRTLNFIGNPPTPSDIETWNLEVEDWHAPANISRVETAKSYHTYNLTTLKPWSSIDQALTNISGVGTYTTSFSAPAAFNTSALSATLSLGSIQNTVRAKMNGHSVDPIDPTDAIVNVTRYVKPGINTLEVRITTTLFNRIRSYGDAIKSGNVSPDTVNTGYDALPAQEYGLLGPVSVEWAVVHRIA